MSPELEKRILLGILTLIDESPGSNSGRGRSLAVLLFVIAAAAIFYGLNIFKQLSAPLMLSVLAGIVVGSVAGFYAASALFLERVDVICRVVDRDLIQARLRELGA